MRGTYIAEGGGATTKVSLAQGRETDPFKHGRGVRQGSVGGPLKWCVFVNFWLKWVKDTMKGEGYIMSACKRQTDIRSAFDQQAPEPIERAELIGQKFIDDDLPAASSSYLE